VPDVISETTLTCNNLTAIFQNSNKDPGTLTNVIKTSQNNCNKGLVCKNGIVLFYKKHPFK